MQSKILFCLILVLFQSSIHARPKINKLNKLNPVILTPGIAGSQLIAKLNKPSIPHYYCTQKTDDWFNIWLNLELIVPFAINCWVDNVKLKYDNVTRKTSNQDGVEIMTTEFGNTSTIEYINPSRIRYTVYFDPLVKSLEANGYEIGLNLFGTPFDFRKSPAEIPDFFTNFDKIIESSYKNNGNQPVILVCHSMGCLMIYWHLNTKKQAWKDTYIKSLITLGAPWGGSVKSLKEVITGDNLGVTFMDSLSIRDVSRTFPSVPFLFPKPGFWREDEPLVSVSLNKNQNITYTSTDYESLLQNISLSDTLEIYKDVAKLIPYVGNPPNVELHCMHGYGLPTVRKLHFPENKFPNGNPIVINGDGDGTVNIRSLEYCQYWGKKQKQPVTYKKYLQVEHMQTVSTVEVVKDVVELITGLKFNTSKELFNDDRYFKENRFSFRALPKDQIKPKFNLNDMKKN